MKKIPTLFQRDPDNMAHLLRTVHPDCQWVLDGEGIATRKYDGTCCMVRDDRLYKRHELRPGKTAPEGFEPAQDIDPSTGKQPGWIPVGDGPSDQWHREAMWEWPRPNGTYELIGPKIQGNAEQALQHQLIAHADATTYPDVPRDFDGMRAWLLACPHEGIVWHHLDGRMAKLKRKDFPDV